jgi:hypothetical protein
VGGTQNVSFLGRRYFKLPILSCPRIPPATQARPTSAVVTSNTLVLVLLASREHAHDILLVSVLVSEVELKLSNREIIYRRTPL